VGGGVGDVVWAGMATAEKVIAANKKSSS
jgi:hypothetical protein